MFLLVMGIVILFECTISLELLELRVPAHVPQGTRAALSCRWQLGPAEVLYSVKWYKDGQEFFRHVPRNIEPKRKFPLPGVDVVEFDPSGSQIVLMPAVLETSGRYRCEVSGEGPLFPTVSEYADMAVVILPENGPSLSGLTSKYHLGDRIRVNCTSGKSRPSTSLAWYINGEPLPDLATIHRFESGLDSTSLILDFVADETRFKNDVIKVKCLATMTPIYWKSNEESAVLDRTHDHLDKRNTITIRADRVQVNSSNFENPMFILVYFVMIYVATLCF